MRLWSLHPKHLDRQGLLAVWREALLAQAVLRGRTRGYRQHPQLNRFRYHPTPLQAVNAYLYSVFIEATARGYRFDKKKSRKPPRSLDLIPVRRGQLEYEWSHLKSKMKRRDRPRYDQMSDATMEPHPLFRIVPG
ncbi:MAG: pyrimidine dimer DNA glycosylase/endonuclease V, partial [Planctomycetota bacterium]